MVIEAYFLLTIFGKSNKCMTSWSSITFLVKMIYFGYCSKGKQITQSFLSSPPWSVNNFQKSSPVLELKINSVINRFSCQITFECLMNLNFVNISIIYKQNKARLVQKSINVAFIACEINCLIIGNQLLNALCKL